MGLDMWAYKVRKLNNMELEDVEEDSPDILKFPKETFYSDNRIQFGWCEEETCREGDKYKDLIPYVSEKTFVVPVFNEKRFNDAYNVTPETKMTGASFVDGVYTYHFEEDGKRRSVEIDHMEYEKFFDQKPVVFCVCGYEEVKYWRKNYDLEERLYTMYKKANSRSMYNCGYFKMNCYMSRACGLHNSDLEKDEAYIYTEWY